MQRLVRLAARPIPTSPLAVVSSARTRIGAVRATSSGAGSAPPDGFLPKKKTFTKEVMVAGSGPKPMPQQYVTVAADLYLADANGDKGTGIWSTHQPSGFLFSATKGAEPFEYMAGVGGVVKGWEDGVASMQLGERARLNIPWQYAYGAGGYPGFKIPPKSDLIFEIEVLNIKD